MTQSKAATLKHQMKQEFSQIYNLCREILGKATKPSLIKATLETLLRFVHWVPVAYIFETDLIPTLQSKVREKKRKEKALKILILCDTSSLKYLNLEMLL